MTKGWHREHRRHVLAGKGIKSTYPESRLQVQTEMYEKPPLYDNYPPKLTVNERMIYLEELSTAQSEEEKSAIFKKWEDWKSNRRGKYVDRVIANIEHEGYQHRPFYVYKGESLPEMYRWVEGDELVEGKDRLHGFVTPYGDVDQFPGFMTYDEYISQYGRYDRAVRTPEEEDIYQARKKARKLEKGTVADEKEAEKVFKSHEERRIEEMKERRRMFQDSKR